VPVSWPGRFGRSYGHKGRNRVRRKGQIFQTRDRSVWIPVPEGDVGPVGWSRIDGDLVVPNVRTAA